MTFDPSAQPIGHAGVAGRRSPSNARGGRLATWLGLLLLALTLLGCARGGGGEAEGLLGGRAPSRSEGVSSPERITDGVAPRPGSPWNSNRTSIFQSRSAFVEYDLGSEQRIAAAAVLADNNDHYELSVSRDGERFEPVWTAEAASGAGLRWRVTKDLDATARYVRLRARRGDASVSVGELVLYSDPNVVLPPPIKEVSSMPSDLEYRNALLVFATAVAFAVAFAYQGASAGWLALLGLMVVASAIPLVRAFEGAWPIEQLEVSLTRGVMAALGMAVVVRETFGPRRYPAQQGIQVATLALAGLVSVLAFYNLGRAQFHDHRNDEPSYVHNYDMRVYYPVAKYFDELRYDGLYLASVATYAEDHGGVDAAHLQKVELRDLRDHRMRRVEEVRDQIIAVKDRFTPERWAALKEDMRYFWETMGPRAYLGSMRDHGGNATPFWLAITHLMFAKTQASNQVLLLGALLDPLMLVGLFVAVWRSFGVRTALMCLIVFGANDFYMFGSNWGGATLRHDWMVYLGLGACALKTQRWALGGALLALSALIRAFPAIALIALAAPLVWWAVDHFRKTQRLPTLSELLAEHRWFVRTAYGAAGCAAVVFLFSSAVLGLEAWPLWVKKIASFTSDPHVNHVSLLTVTSGSEGNQALVRASRMPFHVAATAVYVGLAAWVARRAAPHQVALLGMLLMPVLMYPANYYIHFIFLLPMLVDEEAAGTLPRFGKHTAQVWLLLLGLCAAQYFTVKEKDLAIHFYNASVLLMAALLGILLVLVDWVRSLEGSAVSAEGTLTVGALPGGPGEKALEGSSGGAEQREPSPSDAAPSEATEDGAAEGGTAESGAAGDEAAPPEPAPAEAKKVDAEKAADTEKTDA